MITNDRIDMTVTIGCQRMRPTIVNETIEVETEVTGTETGESTKEGTFSHNRNEYR